MNCIQCGSTLDTNFVSGGRNSSCVKCHLKYVSVAYLMKQSDTALIREFWEFTLAGDWRLGPPCPHCKTPLSMVPLLYKGERHPVLGCKTCYHLILKDATMSYFETENYENKKLERAEQSKFIRKPDLLDEIVNRAAKATHSRWTFRVGSDSGREYAVAISFWGLVLSLGCFILLKNGSEAFYWGFITSACAFGAGLCFTRMPSKAPKSSESDITDWIRNTKDLGPQNNAGKNIQATDRSSYLKRRKESRKG